jgi:hypothetical protein
MSYKLNIGERHTVNGESGSGQYQLAVGANLLPTATTKVCHLLPTATAYCDCPSETRMAVRERERERERE